MFHHRTSAFDRNVSALESRLHALESEIEKLGRSAGRRASAGVSVAGDQIGDAIGVAVNEIVQRFRGGRRVAEDEALRLGHDAAKFGAKVGNDVLRRVASEVEHRPLVTLAVAIGVGILIGTAGGMAKRR